jgi:hypothetical protein
LADSMIPENLLELMKPSTDPTIWREAAQIISSIFNEKLGPEKHTFLTEVATKMNVHSWPNERRTYTFGSFETEEVISYLRQKQLQYINWQTLFDQKALWGKPDDLKKVYEAACEEGAGGNINLNNSLVVSTSRIATLPGVVRIPNPEVIDAILSLGANPGVGYNQCLEEIRKNNKDIGRVFARYCEGQKHLNFKYQADQLRGKGDFVMYRALYDLHLEYGRFRRVDLETLEETKDDLKMRIIFNFSARRVTEIYEMVAPPVIRDFSFDDYEENALHQAREKLMEIGGRPTDSGSVRWDKKTAPPTIPTLSRKLKDPNAGP